MTEFKNRSKVNSMNHPKKKTVIRSLVDKDMD